MTGLGFSRVLLAGFAAAGMAACQAQPAQPQASAGTAAAQGGAVGRHPVSGLEVVPLTVTSDGRQHRFRVEVARTDSQQQRGLMERQTLGPDEGMIFPYNPPRMQSFWMKNTPLPLDIIFIGHDGRIINIAANTRPMSEEQYLSEAPASLVLELRGGRAGELGIGPGDLVEW